MNSILVCFRNGNLTYALPVLLISLFLSACTAPKEPAIESTSPEIGSGKLSGAFNSRIQHLAMYAYEDSSGRTQANLHGIDPDTDHIECIIRTIDGYLYGKTYRARERCYDGDERLSPTPNVARSGTPLSDIQAYYGIDSMKPTLGDGRPRKTTGM